MNDAFSEDEQGKILNTNVPADKNPDYSTNSGNTTTDKVFLLSISEANKYFSSDRERLCKPTAYAVANGAYVYSDNGCCDWWLRSPGFRQRFAAYVYYDGSVNSGGGTIGSTGGTVYHVLACVRPALWITLDS